MGLILIRILAEEIRATLTFKNEQGVADFFEFEL